MLSIALDSTGVLATAVQVHPEPEGLAVRGQRLRRGDTAPLVDVEPEQAYRMNAQVGGEVPRYCTAVGRAILSRLPEAAILDAAALPAR
jgi:DNA-binding IclR family transcriptional regulator